MTTEAVDATPDEAVQYAVSALRAGKIAVAENVLDQVLDPFPEHADALHFLGLLRVQQGRGDEGIELVRRSLSVAPNNAGAWNNLANLYYQAGNPVAARDAYMCCLDLAPDFPDALANVGLLLRHEGKIDEAEALYRRALAIRPDFAEVLNNLGTILTARGQFADAIETLERALELEPRFGDAYTNLGDAYGKLGDRKAAADCHWKAIALRHGDKVARKLLIYALVETGEREKAVTVAREWIEMAPDDPDARHHYAAITGENVPLRASDDYVSTVFDKFAASFDSSLSQLGYRAPELCAAALAERIPVPRQDLAVLDAGCGTGLCGPSLKPYARVLEGIDLSAGMLAKAAARGVYDHLEKAELTAALAARPGAFDVIVSADTFCYFGDLDDVLRASAAALRPGGWLIFTVERIGADDAADYRIHPGNGRYAHSQAYIASRLGDAGLTNVSLSDGDLRLEGGKPVAGYVVVAQRI